MLLYISNVTIAACAAADGGAALAVTIAALQRRFPASTEAPVEAIDFEWKVSGMSTSNLFIAAPRTSP